MRWILPDAVGREQFHAGSCTDAYAFLGAHPAMSGKTPCWHFAVWAPQAKKVCVTGAFCQWAYEKYPMEKGEDGIWELGLPASLLTKGKEKERLHAYQYAVLGNDGVWRLKSDPYGFFSEQRPRHASVLYDLSGYRWNDGVWMEKRLKWNAQRSPVNIYEMHLGSWLRGRGGRVKTYSQLADSLIPYVREMGYTHVEFLPLMEHPFDGSWGYQVTGYFSPTARYGDPDQLRELINRLHQAGIGVILDWVPAHFPKDEWGLEKFDGEACYEPGDGRRAEMPRWGTLLFDYARGEVKSFLLSNALYWLKEYHADGLRCDAVSCMIYHDFDRQSGAWIPNQDEGNVNGEAVAFLRSLNEAVKEKCPGAIMIAEESSAFPQVTHPVSEGGLGFDFKWNMGWMNDMLFYIGKDPIYRKYHHDKLTFSLCYAFSEHYILPFSHDEVVHLKRSMLEKHPGNAWQKFAGLRALYGYMMAHPGKKLLFMGGEFGQRSEWQEQAELEWHLLDDPMHPELQECVYRLNHLYRKLPALHRVDDGWEGFQWLSVDNWEGSTVAFMRSAGRCAPLVCLTNFTPHPDAQYRIGLPYDCCLTEIFNSDQAELGGSGQYHSVPVRAEPIPYEKQPFSCLVCAPPLATVYFQVKKISK